MPNVIFPASFMPCQVDDFPAGVERSVKGAIHVKPGTLSLTAGELEHLKKKHPALLAGCQVLSEAPKAKAKKASPPKAPEAAPASAPEAFTPKKFK